MANLFQSVGGTRSGIDHGGVRRNVALSGRYAGQRLNFGNGRTKTAEDGLFELTIGIDIDGAIVRIDGGDSVFAQVEAGLRYRLRSSPASDAEISVFAFIGFIASCDQAKVLWPANG